MTQTASSDIVNCKLLLIGASSVGKSSILLRFTDETYLPEDESSATIGVDFRVCKLEVGGRKIKLSIWDTAGQERFRTITSSYYRGCQAAILVYDISNRETFDALPRWFSELDTYVSSSVVRFVVGNKLDKEFSRQVPTSEGKAFAEKQGALFAEVSAKTSIGIRDVFVDACQRVIDTPELWASVSAVGPRKGANSTMPGGTINVGDEAEPAESGCSC